MIIIGGELGFDILKVSSDMRYIRPNDEKISNDLTMHTIDGNFFHICGNNDWAFLALELLEPIKKEAKNIIQKVKNYIDSGINIKAIILGRNDKRIMDVYFGGRNKCEKIFGIPIIISDKKDLFEVLVEYEEHLPY